MAMEWHVILDRRKRLNKEENGAGANSRVPLADMKKHGVRL